MKNKILLTIIFVLAFLPVYAENYVIVNYDNDLVFNTDYYYSQGISLGYKSQTINPLANLIFPVVYSERISELTLNHKIFTPTNISGNNLSDYDRPYAGLLYFDLAQEQTDKNSNTKLNFDLLLGVIGPLAGGYEVQSFIHRQTKNAPQPKGWKYQISNGLLLDAAAKLEHLSIQSSGIENITTASLELGTLYSNVAIGSKLRLGYLDEYFALENLSQGKDSRQWSAYIVTDAQLKVNFYNSTLLGNFVFEHSPMTLNYKDMELLTVNLSADLVLAFKKSRVELGAVFTSREFTKGRNHAWFTMNYIQQL